MIVALAAIMTTFLLVIGLHEMGHALAAKLCGIKIQRISLGFGKPMLLWRGKTGCEWVWAMWPLGGYVQLLNSRVQKVKPAEFPLCFDKQSVWVRCFVLLAGAFMNLVVAFIALQFYFMLGYKQQAPVIQSVVPNSIAAKAGIHVGDRFFAIAGKETPSWQEVGMQIITHIGEKNVTVRVGSSRVDTHEIKLELQSILIKGKSLLQALGVEPDLSADTKITYPGESFWGAGNKAIQTVGHLLGFFLTMIKLLIIGAIPFSLLLGPLGLLSISVSSFAQGLAVFLYFIASFSLAVGLVNLFPIPGLDGGSMVYAIVEKIRGKAVSVDLEVLLHRLAIILFSVIFVQLVLNDVVRYFYTH